MKLSMYLKSIVASLHPGSHRKLAERTFEDLVKYVVVTSIVGLILSVALFVPGMLSYKTQLESELEKFDTFQVSVNASLNESLTVLDRPRIVVDLSNRSLGGAWMLVTDDSFSYRPYVFFGEQTVEFAEHRRVTDQVNVALYARIILFFLPAIVFWVYVFFMLKAVALVTVVGVLGWMLFLSRTRTFTFADSMKAALIATTPMLLLELALWPVLVWYVVPSIVFVVYYLMAMVMLADRA